MTTRRISAAEARSLRDGREAKGRWRAGTVEAEGKVWAHDPDALGGPSVGEVCIFSANLHLPHTGNRRLAAAAPELCDEVIALHEEVAELRAAVRALSNAEDAYDRARDSYERARLDGDVCAAKVALQCLAGVTR
mgnify:CR=1 FL=1